MTDLKPFNLACETLSTEGAENEHLDNVYRQIHLEKLKDKKKKEREQKIAEEAAELAAKKARTTVSSLGRYGKYTYDYNGGILKVKNPVKRNTVLEVVSKFVDTDKPQTRRKSRKSIRTESSPPLQNKSELTQKSVPTSVNGTEPRGLITGIVEDPIARVLRHYERKDKKLMETMYDPHKYVVLPEAFVPVAGVSFKCQVVINDKEKRNFEKTKPPIKLIMRKNEDGELDKQVNFQEYRDSVIQHESHRHKIIEELAQKHNSYQEYFKSLGMEKVLGELDMNGEEENIRRNIRTGKKAGTMLDLGSANVREIKNVSRRLSSKLDLPDSKIDTPQKSPRDAFQKVEMRDSNNTSHAVNYNTNLDLLAELIGEKDSHTLLLRSSRLASMENTMKSENENFQNTRFSVVTRSKKPNEVWKDMTAQGNGRTMSGWYRGGNGPEKSLNSTLSQFRGSMSGFRLKNPRKPTDADFTQSIGQKPLTRHRSAPRIMPISSARSFWNV